MHWVKTQRNGIGRGYATCQNVGMRVRQPTDERFSERRVLTRCDLYAMMRYDVQSCDTTTI